MKDLITGKSFPVEVKLVHVEIGNTCIVLAGVGHLDSECFN